MQIVAMEGEKTEAEAEEVERTHKAFAAGMPASGAG